MTVSASIGPISGINYGSLLTGLTQTQQSQIDSLTNRINTLDSQNTAILGLSTLLTGLKVSSANFISSAIFRSSQATSNNPNVINATAGVGTPVGNYSFNVQRLASSSQIVTQGFANSSTTALNLSGTIKFQFGGGALNDVSKLTSLNGGAGVARGSIRIVDRSGASTLVDLSHAVDINDVVNTINSATGVNVVAKVDSDHLVLTDNSGGAGTLSISNTGGTTTASDLGLTTAASGNTITGSSLTKLSASTNLNQLNDGNGVRLAGLGTDFSITGASNSAVAVTLSGAKTIGDVVAAINKAGQSNGISAAISADGHGLTLTDANGGPVTVAAQNNSLAAYDLGILGTSNTGTLTGDQIISGLSGPLLRDLNGGNQGAGSTLPTPGTITINGQSVDLTNARTLDDVIKGINTNTQGVTAAINSVGTGITLTSSAASFTVADGTGNLASFLHIAGNSTAAATGSQTNSGDLRLRYISSNTLLSTLNAGTGFKAGKFAITDGSGTTYTVDLTGSNISTVGDVISAINSTTGGKVTAGINSTGDGILLKQVGGTGTAKVTDIANGTTAASLGLSGSFSSGQLDGSLQKSVSISPTDTLSNIASKLNNISPGLAASIINDGSGATPFRLSISSRNSGFNGRLIFDGSGAGLTGTTLVSGQDAAIVYGGNANGTGGLLATSATNNITTIVPNLTLSLTGVGTTNVAITNDPTKIVSAVQGFVDSYNQVVNNIATVTAFDPNNSANNGVLFGDASVQQVQNALGLFITQSYANLGQYQSLSQVGISVQQDGTLQLNTDTLNAAIAANPDDVRKLFTTNVQAVTGGPHTVGSTTLLSALNTGQTFPPGHILITDGSGAQHDIDLSTGVSTIGDVISRINAGTAGTVTAKINSTGTGLLLTQVGGAGNASVADENGGTTAAALNIRGTFNNGTFNGAFPPIFPSSAVKGIGSTLSDLLTRYTDSSVGILFTASNAILTQEQELKANQTSLNELLTQKKNQLVRQFANLEVNIAGFQSQGSALASLAGTTTSSSSTTKA